MRILVTGAAGFIGYHVSKVLLARGIDVLGVDNCNAYYDPKLKWGRLSELTTAAGFQFVQLDLADYEAVARVADRIDGIIHLAAQAGVRYSMEQPFAYASANVTGHLAILELARKLPGIHLIYASSSSIYGAGSPLPYAENARADHPLSLYAATKRADELMSIAYSHLYGMAQTGLRFFTVYGPWGRPDMAYFSFSEAIMSGRPITLYDGGVLKRDFTYIDDIVAGILGVFDNPSTAGEHRLFNIGNNRAEYVTHLVALLESGLGRKAQILHARKPEADPIETCADVSALSTLCGYAPTTPLDIGIPRFVEWYKDYRSA
jgi:UDP-glucuronate 4-epimerase